MLAVVAPVFIPAAISESRRRAHKGTGLLALGSVGDHRATGWDRRMVPATNGVVVEH